MNFGLDTPLIRPLRRGFIVPLLAVLLSFLLASCAGQAAFREGKNLLAQDKVEEGLASLQRAMSQDMSSGEYKKTYLLARENAVAAFLKEADRLQLGARPDEAAALYRRALNVQPGNALARQGLRQIERQERQRALLADARRALRSRDWAQARGALDAVLRADPVNADALALQTELAAQTALPPADTGLLAAFRKPISIEFKEVPLRQAFEVISRTSGLNFVFDKDVKSEQKVSIFLRDSTVESALHFLLLTNQLEQQTMNGNTVLIYPNSPAKLKDYQELTVRTFQMANADVKSVAATVKTLLKGRDVVIDEKLNMMLVRDTPEVLRVVEKLVALHDIPEPEVMLEVEILEVTRSKLLELGVNWPSSLSLTPLALDSSVGLTLDDLRGLNGSRVGATLGALTLNLKKDDSDINILANPRIRVVNREKAKVLIGDRVPVITVTTSPTGGYSESIAYVDVGLKLDVEPVIYRGNDIVIKVGLEVSNVSGSQTTKLGGVAYTFGTRTANTTLRLHDGENQVLAGLINDEDRRVASKVPGLGDLPMVGRLFGSTLDDGKKSEIVLSITPRLVRNIHRPEGSLLEFRSGTDGSLRERPDSSARAQPKAPAAAPSSGARPLAPPVSASTAPVAVPGMVAGKATQTRVDEGDDVQQ